jgi:uncharacterized cofD-like protein
MAKKIVTIGGGSGQMALLSGLRDLPDVEITAVAGMADSGGSTGRLRDELGILPPGDILKCILALSKHRDSARAILLKRFNGSSRLTGHNAGNMLLAMLAQYAGNFPDGVKALGEILEVRGSILPVTTDRATLVAELDDGSKIFGETAIDIPAGNSRRKIKHVYLVPHHGPGITAHAPVLEAIRKAHLVVIGPGDLYTSIAPNLIVPGVKEALRRAKARIVYVLNIMSKFGETHDFSGEDFVKEMEKTIGRKVDGVIVNAAMPDAALLEKYRREKSEFVTIGRRPTWNGRTIFAADLISVSGGIIRHDSAKLAEAIKGLIRM